MTQPAIMLPKPIRRNMRSSICDIAARARLAAPGFRNGSTPSSTRYSARAAQRSLQCINGPCDQAPRSAPGFLQVLEELTFGRDHQHVALLAERSAIGLH